MKSKFTWILTLCLAFFIQFSFAQEKTITGKVVSSVDQMSLPAVNVLVEGTSRRAETDLDGKFSIKASAGEKLVFSYLGMKTQVVTVGASNTVNVQLADDSKLDEVVVEAYRSTTKAKSNVASTTVTSKTIEGRPNASFIQTLQGQVSGLNISTGSGSPGSTNTTVILRGVGSVNGSIEPLYVVDGMPVNTDNFRSINPNDIESISVLKDAGATSIYGNRGANGVILVKTKRASFDSKLSIKYVGTTGMTYLQGQDYNKMNASETLALEKRYGGQGRGVGMSDAEINAYGAGTDWLDVFFRTGVTQSHTINLTSGSKNMSSFTSLGYFDQQGIVPGSDLKRFNFRNNLTGKSDNGRFTYGTNITVNYSRRNQDLTQTGTSVGNVNYNPLNGGLLSLPYFSPSDYVNGAQLIEEYGPGGGGLETTPLRLLDNIKTLVNRYDELKMLGSANFNYKLTNDLTVGTTMGMDLTNGTALRFQSPTSFVAYAIMGQTGQAYAGFNSESSSIDFAYNGNTSLNYKKSFGKHTIDAGVYTEYYKAHLKTFGTTQNGLDPKTAQPGSGTGYIPFDPSNIFYVPTTNSSKRTAGLFSYFGSLDYDYDSKYGLGATIRRDASYRFNDTNKWGTFWSVSGRWNIDQEAFMENSIFNMLKLRASYGTAGNQNITGGTVYSGANLSREIYASSTGYAAQPSYVVGQLGNPDLKWETIRQANIGIDFQLMNSRLRGTADIYEKKTIDLYQNVPLSAINATSGINANFGSLRNRGVELQLSYDVVKSEDFVFTLNFNGSYNKNELLELPSANGIVWDGGLSINRQGDMIDQYYLIKYAGVNPANGNLLYYDANGAVTENPNPAKDAVFTGKSSIPKYQGGFGFDTSYKGFYITTQFNYVAEVYRFDYDLATLQDPTTIGVFVKSKDLDRAWTPENTVTDIPSLRATNLAVDGGASDRYLRDASYLRLRYASIGYNFSREFIKATPFTGIRTYLQGENMVTWSKWRGFDAESNAGSTQSAYPTPKIFSIGLELEF